MSSSGSIPHPPCCTPLEQTSIPSANLKDVLGCTVPNEGNRFFQILLVGEPHIGQRAMIPSGPWAFRTKMEDRKDALPDFTRDIGAGVFGKTLVHAICYNPCSPRESL